MPYKSKSELPPAVKKLPEHAQKIFMSAFNSAYKQYSGDEEKAFKVAWAAVAKYKKDENLDDNDDEDTAIVTDSMEFTELYDFDSNGLRETADGYLLCKPRVARTGIQLYKGSEFGLDDVDTIRVLRPEDEVFNRDSMQTFAHRPVTIGHPSELVDARNWRKHAVGQTGDEIARDGQHIRVPMMLMDADGVRACNAKQLSVGYTSDIVWRAGVTDSGEEYDAMQRNIKVNHIAIVAQARGGPKLRLGDNNHRGERTMRDQLTRTISVDGIEVTMNDTEASIVSRALGRLGEEKKQLGDEVAKLTKSLGDSTANIETLKKSVETKDGEILALKKKVEDATIKPEDLDRRIAERGTIVDAARKVLGQNYNPAGKTDVQIKRDAVDKFLGDAAKGITDAEVGGAFLVATSGTGTGAETRRLSDALHTNQQNVGDAEKAWLEKQERNSKAWQNPAPTVAH